MFYQMVTGAKIALVGPEPSPSELEGNYLAKGINGLVIPRLLGGIGLTLADVSRLDYAEVERLDDTRYAPNVIIAIGDEAFSKLTGQKSVDKYRGSVVQGPVYNNRPVKVLPTVAPETIIKGNYYLFYITQADFEKARKESEFPDIRRRVWTPVSSPPRQLVEKFLHEIGSEDLWSLDIETRANSIACVGIAHGTRSLCIPIQTTHGPFYQPQDELIVWKCLQDTMLRTSGLVGQNITYDLEWLLDYGCYPSQIKLDAMVGFALLYPEFPKGLDTIVSLYTDAPYYKDDGKTWGWAQPDQRLWEYNQRDAIYTLWAAEEIIKELQLRGLWKRYSEYVGRELYMALEMQRTRLPHDAVTTKHIREIVDAEAQATQAYRSLIGCAVNVNSPKQVKEYLYETKGFKRITSKGKLSADENALRKLRTLYPDCQELELIIKERHLRKKLSSYLNVELDPDKRLGSSWNVAGTETGRWSSGKSPKRRGLNVQTVPKLLRACYVPTPGRVFIQPDLSQAEARVVAYLARCDGLKELFNDPTRSVHMENALAIFGHDVKQDSKEYVLAKQCLHAANYKMGPERFSVEAGISRLRAKEILDTYYARYPEIQTWHTRTKEALLQVGKLVTPLGRERIFYNARAELELTGKMSGESWRNAIAYVPQATVPDILNQGMLKTWEELDYVWLHAQGHDSCLVSVPCDKLGECAERLAANLDISVPIWGDSLTIPVNVQWGFAWFPMLNWEGEAEANPEAYEKLMAEELTQENLRKGLV